MHILKLVTLFVISVFFALQLTAQDTYYMMASGAFTENVEKANLKFIVTENTNNHYELLYSRRNRTKWEDPKFLQAAEKISDSLYYIFEKRNMKDTIVRQILGKNGDFYQIRQSDGSGKLAFDGEAITVFPIQFNGRTIYYDKDEVPMKEVVYIRGKKVNEQFLFNAVNSKNVITSDPQFPGGTKEFIIEIARKTKYPIQEINKGIGGKACVKFVIDEKGNITDIQSAYPFDNALTRALARAVEKVNTSWIPAKSNDEEIPVWYYAAIDFASPVTLIGN